MTSETKDKYDFVKWWMKAQESYETTIQREISEELWDDFKYKILWKSSWYFFYDWSEKLQKERWFRWQLRQNFWIKYESWNINLDYNELSSYKWISKENIIDELKKSDFPEIEIKRFKLDMKEKIWIEI